MVQSFAGRNLSLRNEHKQVIGRKRRSAALLAIAVAGLAQTVHGAGASHTISTTTGTTNWDASTWVGGTPTSLSIGDTIQRTATADATFTTTLNIDVTIGKITQNGSFGSGTWTIANDSTHVLTMDNTGGSGTAFLGVVGANLLTINPNILITNTDLTISQGSSATFGATTALAGSIFVANGQTRSISISSSLTGTAGTAVNISGPIGATALGGGASTATLNISSNGTTVLGTQNFSLGGPIGGAVGIGSTITISNTNAGTGTLAVGALGASVTTVTQNSATAPMTLSGANTTFAGIINVNAGTLNLNGANTGSTATVNLSAGTLNFGSNAAAMGSGSLVISGGSINNSGGPQVLANGFTQTWNGNFSVLGTQTLDMGTSTVALGNDITLTLANINGRNLTIGGAISGAHSLTSIGGASALILTGASTSANGGYSGATTIGTVGSAISGGTLQVSGANGSIAASSGYTINGAGSKLLLDYTGVAGNATVDRLNDGNTNGVTLNLGGELSFTANATAATNTTETMGQLALNTGTEIVTLTQGGTGVETITAGSFSRGSNHATGFIRGTALGTVGTATSTTQLKLTSATGVTLVGTTVASGLQITDATKNLQIVPYLVGDTVALGTGSGTGTFVTYDSTLGFRALSTTEYNAYGAGATGDNISLGTVSVTNAATKTFNSLLMGSSGANLTGVGGGANVLTLNSGAIYFSPNASGSTSTISGFDGITLGNNGTWNEGVITVGNAANATANASLTINSAISVTGSGGLTKAGGGTLALGGSNLYTGVTTVNGGILAIGTGGATGDLGPNTANIVLNTGTVLNVNRTGTLTLVNAITGVGAFQNIAAGTTILSGANTYTGNTNVNSGTLNLSNSLALQNSTLTTGGTGLVFDFSVNSHAFTIGALGGSTDLALQDNATPTPNPVALTVGGNNATTTYSGNLSGAGSLIKVGTGALSLAPGTANTFTGGLTIKSGTIFPQSNVAALGNGTVTLGDTSGSANATLLANGPAPFNTYTNPIVLATGTTGTLSIGTNNGSTAFTYTGGITGTNNVTFSNPAAAGSMATLTFSTNAVNNSGTITNAVTFSSGATSITGGVGSNVTGIIENSTTSAFTVSSAVSVHGAGANATVLTNTSGTKLLTLSGGVIGTGDLVLNNNSATASGITLSITPINNVGAITNSGTGTGTATISSVIGSNVTNITQNSPTSTLVLSGANTAIGGFGAAGSTGTVTVSNGTLQMSIATALGAPNAVTVSGGTFNMNGLDQTIAGLNDGGSSAGTVTNTGTSHVLTLGGSGAYSYGGVITATTPTFLALTVSLTGSGVQTLSGANTYGGATIINSGTLQLNDTTLISALPANALTLGGTLGVQGSAATPVPVTQNVASLALGAGKSSTIALTVAGAGPASATNLTAGGTFTPPTITSGTTLYLNLANAGPSSALTLASTAITNAFAPWAVVTDSNGVTGFGKIASNVLVRDGTNQALLTTSTGAATDYFLTNPSTDNAANQYNNTGTLTLASGAHALNSLFINAAATGNLALNGQTLSLSNNGLAMSGGGTYTISGAGTLNAATAATLLTVNQVGSGTLIINSLINSGGAGGLTKAGSGAVVLGVVNQTYTGPTTVSQGVLNITGSLGNTAVTVATNATLGGSGTVGLGSTPTVIVNGALAPGNLAASPVTGLLTITGPLTLATTSTFSPTLSSSTATSLVVTSSSFTITGNAQLLPVSGSTPNANLTYVLIDNQSGELTSGGTFANAAEGSTVTVGGVPFTITYQYNAEGTGPANDVALTPVPEPATLSLLALGAVGLLARRRRHATV